MDHREMACSCIRAIKRNALFGRFSEPFSAGGGLTLVKDVDRFGEVTGAVAATA
jgi:hypothetical protein